MSELINNREYHQFITKLKSQIQSTQIKAAVSVNRELLNLYWFIGLQIVEKQKTANWGDGLIKQISRDLRYDFPNMKGFSVRNLELIRKWHIYWNQGDTITQQVVSQLEQAPIFQIPWGQNLLIINKANSSEEALFYVEKTIENKIIVEYALKEMQQAMGVSEYQLTQHLPESLQSSLPSIEEIEAELKREVGDE